MSRADDASGAGDPLGNDLSITYDANDDQTLVVVDGDRVGAVVALEGDVSVDEAVDLVDSVEAEVAHMVDGLRTVRTAVREQVADK